MWWYNPLVLAIGAPVAAAVVISIGLFVSKKARSWVGAQLVGLQSAIHRWTAPTIEAVPTRPFYESLEVVADRVRIGLRPNKPILVAEGEVTTLYIWAVIDNFSLESLELVKFDLHFQIGQFVLKQGGLGIGSTVAPQRSLPVSAEVALNDAQARSLRNRIPDYLLRERAVISISCKLESRLGEISKDVALERSNEFVGMSLPAASLRIVAPAFQNHYTPGTLRGRRCFHLSVEMVITNLTNRPIRIVKVGFAEFPGWVPIILKGRDGDELEAGGIADAMALVTIEPPVVYGEDIVATLVVTDNLSNEHRVPGWRLSSLGPDLQSGDSTQ